MKKILILFSLILLTASVIYIRLYCLEKVPVHLGNDEISIAWDAYSIGKTLRDEHNHYLPLSFQSHGDYKAPLYIYLSVLPIKIFGNTEFSARFVSVLAGLLTIAVTGLLVYEISGQKSLGFLTALVLAFCPGHFYASRIAWESNLAAFWVVLGIYLYLLFAKTQKSLILLTLSGLAFALSAYSYHLQKMLSPLLVFFLPLFFPLKNRRQKYFFWAFTFLLVLPLALDLLNQSGTGSRANTQMIWNIPTIHDYLASRHSIVLKFSLLFSTVLSNFSAHINLGYLFFTGLALVPQKTPFQFGWFLAPSLPFLLTGAISGKKYLGKYHRFLFSWLALGLLTSSLTRGEPNLGRNLPNLAPYSILIAIGFMEVSKNARSWLKIAIIGFNGFFLVYFLSFYFVHFPKYSGENWQYGYKQIALFTKSVYQNYDRIIIDSRFGPNNRYVGIPHLYLPYFSDVDPRIIQKRPENNGEIGKYSIKEINWEKEAIKPNRLYVVPEANLPFLEDKSLKLVRTIYLPNSKPAFRIFETI